MALKINKSHWGGKKILVAPLDWGLGHATRCIPIIKEIIESGAEVWLTGEGSQKKLLQLEFPTLPFLELKGYRIKYARIGFAINILFQIPKILLAIRSEHHWLKLQIKKYQFDIIVADNRYGLWNKNCFCIFITHQLFIKTSLGRCADLVLQQINYQFINRFSECWIPDEKNEPCFADELSHPKKTPSIPIKYIGIQSRFEKNNSAVKNNSILIIISGPEPQRTIFEKIILHELDSFNGEAVVLRGLPTSEALIPSTQKIKFYNHLNSELLNEEIIKAEFVISRSGYSTVMDIVKLNKKSILIPTPGQTEQVYLAKHFFKHQFAYSVSQKKFSLLQTLKDAEQFNYETIL